MRQILIAGMATLLIACGVEAAMAGGARDGFGEAPQSTRGPEPKSIVGFMAELLNLTDSQKEQISGILESEREQMQPLREKIDEIRRQIMQAGEAATFDESAVRALGIQQAVLEIDLTVSRARTRSRINAVLTAGQQELLKGLRPEMERRPPPPPGIY